MRYGRTAVSKRHRDVGKRSEDEKVTKQKLIEKIFADLDQESISYVETIYNNYFQKEDNRKIKFFSYDLRDFIENCFQYWRTRDLLDIINYSQYDFFAYYVNKDDNDVDSLFEDDISEAVKGHDRYNDDNLLNCLSENDFDIHKTKSMKKIYEDIIVRVLNNIKEILNDYNECVKNDQETKITIEEKSKLEKMYFNYVKKITKYLEDELKNEDRTDERYYGRKKDSNVFEIIRYTLKSEIVKDIIDEIIEKNSSEANKIFSECISEISVDNITYDDFIKYWNKINKIDNIEEEKNKIYKRNFIERTISNSRYAMNILTGDNCITEEEILDLIKNGSRYIQGVLYLQLQFCEIFGNEYSDEIKKEMLISNFKSQSRYKYPFMQDKMSYQTFEKLSMSEMWQMIHDLTVTKEKDYNQTTNKDIMLNILINKIVEKKTAKFKAGETNTIEDIDKLLQKTKEEVTNQLNELFARIEYLSNNDFRIAYEDKEILVLYNPYKKMLYTLKKGIEEIVLSLENTCCYYVTKDENDKYELQAKNDKEMNFNEIFSEREEAEVRIPFLLMNSNPFSMKISSENSYLFNEIVQNTSSFIDLSNLDVLVKEQLGENVYNEYKEYIKLFSMFYSFKKMLSDDNIKKIIGEDRSEQLRKFIEKNEISKDIDFITTFLSKSVSEKFTEEQLQRLSISKIDVDNKPRYVYIDDTKDELDTITEPELSEIERNGIKQILNLKK